MLRVSLNCLVNMNTPVKTFSEWGSPQILTQTKLETTFFSSQFLNTIKLDIWHNRRDCFQIKSLLQNITLFDYSNQIISENKPYKFGLCTFIYNIKFQEKNLNLNWDSNSDLQISGLALYHWAILVLLPVHLQTLLLK